MQLGIALFKAVQTVSLRVLILLFGKEYSLPSNITMNLAVAVEMLHNYSLVHDDLPAMDDDKYRRGKLSSHIKFNEFTAILAGNSLLTLAFEILSSNNLKLSKQIKINLINSFVN